MIGSIGSSYSGMFPPRLAELNSNLPTLKTAVPTSKSLTADNGIAPGGVASTSEVRGLLPTAPMAQVSGANFGDVLSQAVSGVNTTMQTAEVQKARVMSGDTNNLHQAMISMQEANVAFSLMTEVRNKLVESYQEIMRMQV